MELQRPDSPFQRGYGRKRWKTVCGDFGNQITKALLDSIEKEDSYAFLRNREDFRKLKEKYTSS